MTCILRAERRALLAATLLAAFAAAPAWAQGKYPERPITFIVPFAAGSATDQLARALGASITADTKQAVIVDNKAGASGMMAAQAAARAPADGYTVLISTNTTHAANEHLYKKLPYDPVKDFVPVTGLGKGGQVLVVRADAPYKSVADLLAKAKKEPGKLSFGSGSVFGDDAGTWLEALPRGGARDVRLRIAALHDDRAEAERLPREVTALYTCGPAGGGGVRTGLRQRLSTRSCFVPRGDVPARFAMLEAT
jgi:tripartite-type tricarboxylate transporter receptor subunit TctC